jgi:hypothetical protein
LLSRRWLPPKGRRLRHPLFAEASLGLVQKPQRRRSAVFGCGRPRLFGGEAVVHVDHRDPEGGSEPAVAQVAACCRSRRRGCLDRPLVVPRSRDRESLTGTRRPAAVMSCFDSRRSGRAGRGGALGLLRHLQLFEGAPAADRARRGVEGSAAQRVAAGSGLIKCLSPICMNLSVVGRSSQQGGAVH